MLILPASIHCNANRFSENLFYPHPKDMLINFKERGRPGRETNVDLLLHSLMHSLLDSCVCPDGGLNPQPWCIKTTGNFNLWICSFVYCLSPL